MDKADDVKIQNVIKQNDFFERPKCSYEQFLEARFERKNP